MIPVNMEDLKPGMILARPVRNSQGILLLEAGARITKKNIRIFKSWGVTEVFAKGDLSKSKISGKPGVVAVKKSVEVRLKEKFSDVIDDPIMQAIYEAAAKQLTKDIANGETEK